MAALNGVNRKQIMESTPWHYPQCLLRLSSRPLNLSRLHFSILTFSFSFPRHRIKGTKKLSHCQILRMFKPRTMGQPKAAVGTGRNSSRLKLGEYQ